jgi:glycosyltransferase involved in cell wall biosynthesis
MFRLRARLPQLRYFILGEGAEEHELKRMVNELQLNEVVIFAGTTYQLEDYYCMADVFVMLTDDEGNSIACHEAMSSELPVVVSDTGGFIESVPATAGYLVNPDRTSEIDGSLIKLAEDALLRKAMGQAGRAHILQKYSWDKIAKRFLEQLQ